MTSFLLDSVLIQHIGCWILLFSLFQCYIYNTSLSKYLTFMNKTVQYIPKQVTNFNLYKILGLKNSRNDCYFNSIMHVLFGLNFKLRMEQWQATSTSLYIGKASCLLILKNILYCGCSNKCNLVSDFKSN